MDSRVFQTVKNFARALEGTAAALAVPSEREKHRLCFQVELECQWEGTNPRSMWSLKEIGEDWVLQITDPFFADKLQSWDYATMQTLIPITNVAAPMGIAIDAAMDFMDRVREDNIPDFVEDERSLMQFCVTTSWKRSA